MGTMVPIPGTPGNHVEAFDLTAVLASHALLGWAAPADLRTLWRWCEAGHWPCAVSGSRVVVY